jgi:hypothetical protein
LAEGGTERFLLAFNGTQLSPQAAPPDGSLQPQAMSFFGAIAPPSSDARSNLITTGSIGFPIA